MLKACLAALHAMAILMFVTSGYAERIYSHFDRLPLMREEALSDHNQRAIRNIEYIENTPFGEYFEVDNESLPIEALVTKRTRIKQSKPLEARKDEDILIEYYRKVDAYAGDYIETRDSWLAGRIDDNMAVGQFRMLSQKYPMFSSSFRAVGIIYFSKKKPEQAAGYLKEALQANGRDTVALAVGSMAAYDLGRKTDSLYYVHRAKELDPRLSFMGSWEVNYIQRNSPIVYRDWSKYVDLK